MMKAKFVYEAMGDVLKPKSEEEIISSMDDLDPNILFVKSVRKMFLPGIKKALEMGANVHTLDDWALQWASSGDRYDVVALLLDNGADVHAVDDLALQYAVMNGFDEIIKILLDNGANVDDDILELAQSFGNVAILELLKKYI